MGLEELREHLKDRARSEAKRILEEARSESDTLVKGAKADALRDAEAHAAIVSEAERRARGEVVQADREASRSIGDAYSAVLDRAIERALEKLSGQPDDAHSDYIVRCLAAGDEHLGAFVITAAREADAKMISSMGRTVDTVAGGAGGILMVSPDGKALDLRYETVVEGMRDTIWQMVIEDLSGVDGND